MYTRRRWLLFLPHELAIAVHQIIAVKNLFALAHSVSTTAVPLTSALRFKAYVIQCLQPSALVNFKFIPFLAHRGTVIVQSNLPKYLLFLKAIFIYVAPMLWYLLTPTTLKECNLSSRRTPVTYPILPGQFVIFHLPPTSLVKLERLSLLQTSPMRDQTLFNINSS